jgi:hypothetical protein
MDGWMDAVSRTSRGRPSRQMLQGPTRTAAHVHTAESSSVRVQSHEMKRCNPPCGAHGRNDTDVCSACRIGKSLLTIGCICIDNYSFEAHRECNVLQHSRLSGRKKQKRKALVSSSADGNGSEGGLGARCSRDSRLFEGRICFEFPFSFPSPSPTKRVVRVILWMSSSC